MNLLFEPLTDSHFNKYLRRCGLQLMDIDMHFNSGFYEGMSGFDLTRYGAARYNFGSAFAVLASIWNLHRIRQKVIKYALVICRSKDRRILYPVN